MVLTDIDVGQHGTGRSGRLRSKSERATTTVDCLGLGHGSSIMTVSKIMYGLPSWTSEHFKVEVRRNSIGLRLGASLCSRQSTRAAVAASYGIR